MQVNDIIVLDNVVETGGVQTVFTQHWKCIGLNGADADSVIVNDLSVLQWNAIKGFLSADTVLSCVKMINETTPAKEIVFPAGQVGTGIGGAHPPHQCLRIDLYGKAGATNAMWRNSNNISGVVKSLSTRGRVNDPADIDAALTFFSTDQDTGAGGAVLTPQVRRMTDPGAPSVPGPYVAPTYAYYDVLYARFDATLRTLKNRKYELCV